MNELIKKCPMCGGRVEGKKAEKIINAGRDFVILEVNAGVCEQCGEKIYTKETHEKIREIRKELYNPNFNPLEFEGIKNQAGLNRFTLSIKQWVEKTNLVGIDDGENFTVNKN